MSDQPLLKQGATGPDVEALQRLLYSVDVDGVFGIATSEAVHAFQSAQGLDSDGIVGPHTWAALMRPVAPADGDLDAVARLSGFAGRGRYVLGAGGVNPRAPTPFTWKGAQNGSDCIGAVMWAEGCSRHHDAFPEYTGDINVDSALMDAGVIQGDKMSGKFFRVHGQNDPMVGAIICYPSVWAKDVWPGKEAENGHKPDDMIRMGHVGLVAGWDGIGDDPSKPALGWDGSLASLITVECCAEWPAVVLGRNRHFTGGAQFVRGVRNPKWGVALLKYVGPRFA